MNNKSESLLLDAEKDAVQKSISDTWALHYI